MTIELQTCAESSLENNSLPLIPQIMKVDKYQMNCTGLEKQENLKFLTWYSPLQNKALKLGTFLGHPVHKTSCCYIVKTNGIRLQKQ